MAYKRQIFGKFTTIWKSGMPPSFRITKLFTCCEIEVIEAAKALRLGLFGGLKSPLFLLGLLAG